MKIRFTLFMCILLIFVLPVQAFAHDSMKSQICNAGGEMYGWWVDCNNHQYDNSFTYNHSLDVHRHILCR
jgi:hypothetical protein